MQGIEVRLLGPVEVVLDGQVLPLGSTKQKALLAMLGLRVNEAVSLDALVEELWGESAPPSASATAQSLVSRLRRALRTGPAGGASLPARGSGYALQIDPQRVDASRFTALAAAGREALARGDGSAAADALRAALDCWRGSALAGLAVEGRLLLEANRLEEERLGVVESLAEAELARGAHAAALTLIEPHVAEHPLREGAWASLMLALYRLGRQADALAAFQRLRAVLADEHGIDPTPALRELEAQILAQHPGLRAPTPAGAAAGTGEVAAARAFGDTVAFLFTDIESSTRAWEGDPDAMSRTLAEHDRLLAEACEVWGGRAFGHTGDGMCAAFPTAAAAVGAAVAGQRALTGVTRVKVRMGVHAGEVEQRAGNYFGPTLNRTARLMALAWGGQIVCSAAAAGLAADRLADGIDLLDLGEVRLPDLTRPERVFQVRHPAISADFPPLRARSGPRTNLPSALSSFIGRVDEA